MIIIWRCYNHIWFLINPIWSEKRGLLQKNVSDQKGLESEMKLSEITMSETFFGENVNTGINCFESVHGQKLIFWFKNVEFDKLNFMSN